MARTRTMSRISFTVAAAAALPLLMAANSVERRLYPDKVESSTFLWNDWNRFQENYHPLYIADDDPKTAWVEGADGVGTGEWVRLKITTLDGTTRVRLRIRNGYQKSKSLYKKNARPKQVTVVLLPSKTKHVATLTDELRWQELVLAQPAGKLEAIELRVDSVYPGTKYEDTCVSDVQVFATATTPDNPAFEKSKRERLLRWKRERAAAAAMFKTKAALELPLSPQYQVVEGADGVASTDAGKRCKWDSVCLTRAAIDAAVKSKAKSKLVSAHAAALTFATEAMANDFAGWVPVQAVSTDKRAFPVVDGLRVPTLWDSFEGFDIDPGAFALPLADRLGFLRAEQVGSFDVKDGPSRANALAAKGATCRREEGTVHAWTPRERVTTAKGSSRVRALLLVRCGTIEVRDGSERAAAMQLLVYDTEGRLELLAGHGYVQLLSWRTGPRGPMLASGVRVTSTDEPASQLREVALTAKK